MNGSVFVSGLSDGFMDCFHGNASNSSVGPSYVCDRIQRQLMFKLVSKWKHAISWVHKAKRQIQPQEGKKTVETPGLGPAWKMWW